MEHEDVPRDRVAADPPSAREQGLDGSANLSSSTAAEPYERESSPRGRENMLPGRERRRFGLERLLVRLVATCGIVGIGVALGAILAASKVQGWITGLVIAVVSVILAAMLWSSRQL